MGKSMQLEAGISKGIELKPRTNKRVQLEQRIAWTFLWGSALLTLGILFIIIGHILKEGLASVNLEFLVKEPEDMGRAGGIYSTIVTTVYLTILSLLIATPLGIGSAIYLNEYTRENIFTRIIRFGTETLAGIPSIIFGLFGFAFLVIYLNLQWSLISGALTVAFMILPVIIRTSEEALKTVPKSYREGSLALGATKWQTISKIILPSALPGIVTGVILSIGRIIGETAALLLTLGGALYIPQSLFDPGRTMSMHLYSLAAEVGAMDKAYATSTVLIFTIFIINFLASFITKKFMRKFTG